MISKAFLQKSEYVDFDAANIQSKIAELFSANMSDTEKAKVAFNFVRDEIPHSFDCNAKVITAKASDVLKNKTGICHAKSNLLVALLRSQSIPSGFCFEHITLSRDDSLGYCVHGFVAAYIENHWVKLDPRGNKSYVNAQFDLNKPSYAYPPRKEYDEYFFPGLYANSHKETMQILEKAKNLDDIMSTIPEFVTEKPDLSETEAFEKKFIYENN